jgi:pimeloyl-ACP methyl ester carboxylesterase
MTGNSTRMPHVSPRQLHRLRRLFSIIQAISPRLAAHAALRLFITPMRRKSEAIDADWLKTAKLHSVAVGSSRVHVHEWGTGARTVVILHGWGSHAPRYSTLAQSLVTAGWRVLAIDAPGHGRSPGRTSSLPQFIDALDVVIRAFGPVEALIGHSLGGLAAALWLAQTPAHQSAIRHAVLISTPLDAGFLVDNFVAMIGLREATTRHLLSRFTSRFEKSPEGWSAAAIADAIRIPVLLVHDRDDDVVPVAHSERLLEVLPNARLYATTGLGHSGMLRDSATVSLINQELSR